MKLKRIMAMVLCFAMVLSTMSFSAFAEDATYVAKVGDIECVDAAAMISELNNASGDVTVEINGKIKTTGFGLSNSNITKLSFVAMTDDAEICVDGVSYIDVRNTNYPIEYTGLTLSHINAGQNIDGFLPQYFSTYNGGNVTYKNCTFPNGVTACGSVAGTTYEFTDCTFNNTTSGLYSLWIYGNSTNVIVDGGTFSGVRGIKLYSEGSDDFSSLSVCRATFSDTITEKHAVVLTKAESVTLTNNTFNNAKGMVQVDDDYASLIEGKIVVIDGAKYVVDSDNLALKEVFPEVAGTLGTMYVQTANTGSNNTDRNRVYGEITGMANITESLVVELYSDETLIATTTLAKSEYLSNSTLGVNIVISGSASSSWSTVWEDGMPRADLVPTKAVLYLDGKEMNTANVTLNGIDNLGEATVWETLPGVNPVISKPEGNDFTGYTNETSIWGEVWGNAKECFEIKILDANGNVMGTTSLKNIGGIIDGDVNVTWNIKLDAASNTDEYWTMNWITAPSLTNAPAKVELWVDGVRVSGGEVQLNGPDNLNKIYAAIANSEGKIVSYETSLANAAADAKSGDTVLLLCDSTETVEFAEGVILDKNGFEAANVTVIQAGLSGKGTEEEPYLINDIEDLKWFRDDVNSGNNYSGKFVKLTADLTLSGAWNSIGNGSRSGSSYTGNCFAGTFNGGNYAISGLTASLFGIVIGTVKDVNLVADINDATNDSVGAAVAVLVGGTVDDVDVSGTVTAKKAAGGVAGRVLAIGEIKNCDNTATVTSTGSSDAAGGIVGKAYYTSTSGVMNITDCTNTGAINGGYAAGGIVGFSAANVSNCKNSGIVNSTGIEAGGIVGEQTNYGTVSSNKNSANVTGGIAGGIVGWVRYQTNTANYPLTETVAISDNTNTGSISSGTDISSLSCAGGIVGNIYNQATVTGNTNNAATISAATFAAGIVGALQPTNDNVDIDGATFTVTGNTTTTTAENITANCTDLVAYNNVGSDATIENNIVPSATTYVAQIGDVKYTDLQAAIDAAATGTGNVTVEILDNINLSGVDWNPVTVSGPGYPVVTVNGNEKTITGLNDMLFAGTWAGKSGLIINDLTIANSIIVNDENDEIGTVGVGAFIGYPQASSTITLNNCHLVNSTVKGGHWTGGLIGIAGGYSGNDGPVFMNLTIKNCSVTGSTITGKGSAGGISGHAANDAWTNVVIENTTVSGNTIKSTGSSNNKAGAVMGTIGAAGQPTTTNGVTKTGGASVSATVSGNTVTSNGTTITTIYGRQGTSTGMLCVTGGNYDNYPIEENVSYAKPAEGYEIVQNDNGTYGVVEKADLFELRGANVKLTSDLTMFFYIPKEELKSEVDYYATITKANVGKEATVVNVQMSEWESYNDELYRVAFDELMAYMMNDKIEVQIFDDDGNAVSDIWTDSMSLYAHRIYANQNDKYKTALVDMLNYGAACQTYFEYDVENLANKDLTDEQKNMASVDSSLTDSCVKGDNYYGSSLTCDSTLILQFYFENIDETMTAKITYINAYGREVTETIDGSEFNKRTAALTGVKVGLAAYDAQQLVKCEVYDGETRVAYAEDSIESYVARMASTNDVYTTIMKFALSSKSVLVEK